MYPIVLALAGRRVVVVGGGTVAERKVRSLCEAGAEVTVISPVVSPALERSAADGTIRWEARLFAFGDCAGARLAFAATDEPGVNAAVVVDARRHGVLVNDAGDAGRGDFHTPAVHRSGALTVAVDSNGTAPAFSARIRDELAVQFEARYARAAATLAAVRERILTVVPADRRAEVMAHFVGRDIDDLAAMPRGAVEHEVERAVDTLGGVEPGRPAMLTCASRKSALAVHQTRLVMAQLAEAGIASTLLTVTTKGDAVVDRPLSAVGGDGVFVKELEAALRDGRADYAVHSCKDLPSLLPADMTIAAITRRVDPRDAFCSERFPSFDALPAGARVGTSSPRRRAQLAARRPDLRFEDVRGNVDTRLAKLRAGDYDAIVLACAGLERLGVRATHTVPFPVEQLVPAVGQGALAIETMAEGAQRARLRAALDDPSTRLAVGAERAFLRTLRGGCQAPVGAYGEATPDGWRFQAVIAAADGSAEIRRSIELPPAPEAAEAAAAELADEMLSAGGAALLADVSPAHPLSGQLFLLPRTRREPSRIAAALRTAGAEVVEAVDAAAARSGLAGRTPTAILLPSSGAVALVAPYLTALRAGAARPAVAAMGPASAAASEALGWTADVIAPEAETAAFVQAVTRFVLENASA